MLSAKALDLFLEELMKSTAEIAVAHGAKTVSAGHLKACIAANEKFDFLQEIVEGVPDLPVGGDKAGVDSKVKVKRERSAPSGPPAGPVAGSLDDDDFGAPPPKVMRPAPPGTLDDDAAPVAPGSFDEPAPWSFDEPAPVAAPAPAPTAPTAPMAVPTAPAATLVPAPPMVGSLGGGDEDLGAAPPPASFGTLTGSLGAEDDDYDDL